ncbi:hypothetical protein GCM10011360_17360 [Primorskyibacter flagellatus]|uniref:Uncharacterized protein n=1 Tax=Primorskyibacter flagellatus TaxID=1387277 RepID=A0A917A666_9RHOB|nr:hypothetical protein [Primorskyibacter flagellatus]GGE29833.1 hypothetical protein GCM10011360_17360 [Primorskyibacter flagellatus]
MAVLDDNDIEYDWSDGEILTVRTLFQNRQIGSKIAIATGSTAPTHECDGVLLNFEDSLGIAAGVTVYWRRCSGNTAIVSRTEVE